MPALDHDTGIYNVQGTLLLWLQGKLAANTPASVSAVVLRTETPEEAIHCPMWSAHFLGYDDDPTAIQGRYVSGGAYGARRYGLMEVSAWVSRNTVGWRAQLYQMVDAVVKSVHEVRETGSAIKLRDFYASSTNPAELAVKITLDSVEVRQPPTDPNPDIERLRVLISFSWVERQ